eukprot:TRINITY_DN70706_c0_g1_i1.p1 TRINITY_DN70706_c0_g1~~TRINITY_DN70706_c0_g1_i1.p1  ORF type:complete len:284 (-),score=20.01 TRINITY_DN70706_c0_g1_i1:64-915(-)
MSRPWAEESKLKKLLNDRFLKYLCRMIGATWTKGDCEEGGGEPWFARSDNTKLLWEHLCTYSYATPIFDQGSASKDLRLRETKLSLGRSVHQHCCKIWDAGPTDATPYWVQLTFSPVGPTVLQNVQYYDAKQRKPGYYEAVTFYHDYCDLQLHVELLCCPPQQAEEDPCVWLVWVPGWILYHSLSLVPKKNKNRKRRELEDTSSTPAGTRQRMSPQPIVAADHVGLALPLSSSVSPPETGYLLPCAQQGALLCSTVNSSSIVEPTEQHEQVDPVLALLDQCLI